MADRSEAHRPGTGLVLAFVGTLVVTLVASAAIAWAAPAPPSAAASGTAGPLKGVTSSTGSFSLSLPASYTVQADGEDDEGRLFFAAGAGDGYGDFEAEGVSVVFVPVKPGSATAPDSSIDLRLAMDSLTSNAQRCDHVGSWTDGTTGAIAPPDGDDDHVDWEWTGCPNGWVERAFAYFEPTGRYGVVVAARAQDSDSAEGLVSQTLGSLQVAG